MKFDQLILSKIIKIVATRCKLSWLKCTKFDFGWGSAPDPAGGAYSAPPEDPMAGLMGPNSKGRGGGDSGRENGRGREGAERRGWGIEEGKGERKGCPGFALKYMVTLLMTDLRSILR